MSNENPKLEILDFWAPWCGPCHIMAPIIDELEKIYAGKVKFTKINIDEEPTISDQYQVRSIPTYIFKKAGQIVDSATGAMSKADFQKKIEENL